jgi:hypothetical protein
MVAWLCMFAVVPSLPLSPPSPSCPCIVLPQAPAVQSLPSFALQPAAGSAAASTRASVAPGAAAPTLLRPFARTAGVSEDVRAVWLHAAELHTHEAPLVPLWAHPLCTMVPVEARGGVAGAALGGRAMQRVLAGLGALVGQPAARHGAGVRGPSPDGKAQPLLGAWPVLCPVPCALCFLPVCVYVCGVVAEG